MSPATRGSGQFCSRTILVGRWGRSGKEKVEMTGFYLQLGLVALGGLLVFLFGLYSTNREKKRS